MSQIYSDPSREVDPVALPDMETFYHEGGELGDVLDAESEAGWYYWFCLPGCLPDSDPIGPFETEEEAIDAAREWGE